MSQRLQEKFDYEAFNFFDDETLSEGHSPEAAYMACRLAFYEGTLLTLLSSIDAKIIQNGNRDSAYTPPFAASRDGNIRVVKLNKPTPQEERQY
ncbi:hypothetical protein V8E54_006420 [Elaphomyces granulatus]